MAVNIFYTLTLTGVVLMLFEMNDKVENYFKNLHTFLLTARRECLGLHNVEHGQNIVGDAHDSR